MKRKSLSLNEWCILLVAARNEGLDPREPDRKIGLRAMARAFPEAGRIGELVILWAIALEQLETDDLTVTEFARWADSEFEESERTWWRRIGEFREVWSPLGHEDPNELAVQIRDTARRMRVGFGTGDVGRLMAAHVAA